MDFLSLGTARFAYEEHGGGPTLVFLHPGVGDHRVWSETTTLLPDCHTFTYDRRGFGFTESEPQQHSSVEDLRSILDARGIGRTVLVGNSQGGRIAIDMTLAYPERVRGLVLIGPAVSGAPWPDDGGAVRELSIQIEEAEGREDLDAVNRLEAHLWLDGPECGEGRVVGPARELFLDMNGRALRFGDIGEAVPAPSAWDRLSELQIPVLVLFGEYDVAALRDIAKVIAERAPLGEYRELSGVAHVPQMEDPKLCAQIISGFTQMLPGA